MLDEQDLIEQIRKNPDNDSYRLVYADWLEENGSVKQAGYLREEIAWRQSGPNLSKRKREKNRKQLATLREGIDFGWLLTMDRPPIELCDIAEEQASRNRPNHSQVKFQLECPKQWDKLQSTTEPKVRYCNECEQNVHYCETMSEAFECALSSQCVAIPITIKRRKGDLPRGELLMGLIIPPEPLIGGSEAAEDMQKPSDDSGPVS